jgi:hypothetical protein
VSRVHRRQRRIYFFTILVGAVGLINVLFFLILYAPVRLEYLRLQDSIERLRTEIALRQQQILQKERTISQLETSTQDRQQLLSKHLIPASVAFAQVLPELDGLVRRAGVRKTDVAYAPDAVPAYGLYTVKITYPVTGGYSNVMNFLKEIEQSETFYIIKAIGVSGSEPSAQTAANISLSLDMETFFYQ